ncbi:NAD(P)-binding domain-containing protein [Chitinophaga pendula]|uniref:NAD(P)-dependent oxidoreductase n=1 Tax=Chitinophaga TaxID=79328 RepID=UPI000BAFE514|nr:MULTISPECIES: NAD(P)-binding domain-containing protein [Chitinophaga]ASZ14115.1 6-phosphogluconate dehydrogenase [Chitinophaga sp. MD30]UCJ08250.1 NAD(P)-binding domain-containing protein [Chitinophaga pendula]
MTTIANQNKSVTLIGLGPMGQTMAQLFLDKGLRVTLWNRTPSRAAALVSNGAILADTPSAALAASELIILSLTDYPAMYDILGDAGDALKGKVLVNLSSDTPEKAREATRWAQERGAAFIAGGVMVPPQLLGGPTSYAFFSGPKDLVDAHHSTLEIIGRVDYRGEDPGLAPLYYQALLDVMFTSTAGVLHAAALLGSAGVDVATFSPYIQDFLKFMSVLLADVADDVDNRRYDGSLNNMIMMAATTDHIVDASQQAGVSTRLPKLIREIYNETVAKGYGKNGLFSIYEVLKQPS